jgi:glycosyltransferase involved in cell wall biosynthesis
LSDEQFRGRFASAAMVVFPSDFEGFGLPAVEAMRLGIPVVVTPDPALLEVTGGHAAVMSGWGPPELADAVRRAQDTTADELAQAREHAAAFTWSRMATRTRAALMEAIRIDEVPAGD